jgi:hypothetical protein
MKIKITDDKKALTLVWDGDYADKHAGKVYGATIDSDGWAHSDEAQAKFPPHSFAPSPFDAVGFIMDYESGNLDEDAIIDGFQAMINDGTVWHLQGHYGRTAAALIEAELCTRPCDIETTATQ